MEGHFLPLRTLLPLADLLQTPKGVLDYAVTTICYSP